MEYLNLEFAKWLVVGLLTAAIGTVLFFYAESFSYWEVRRNRRAFRIMAVTDWTLRGVILALWIGPPAWIIWRYGKEASSQFYGCISAYGVWLALLFLALVANALRQERSQEELKAKIPPPRDLRKWISGGKWR